MSEIKLTVTFRAPHTPRLGLDYETDAEVKRRTLNLHQKFLKQRKQIEAEFKKKKISVSNYHSKLIHLAQDQFAYGLFISWKKIYLTYDGERRFILLVTPF